MTATLDAEIAEIETQIRRTIAEGGDCTDLFAEIAKLGLTRCQTCITGCQHGGSAGGEPGSCAHSGCWGPDATNDCAGVPFARVAILTSAEWAEIDNPAVLATA